MINDNKEMISWMKSPLWPQPIAYPEKSFPHHKGVLQYDEEWGRPLVYALWNKLVNPPSQTPPPSPLNSLSSLIIDTNYILRIRMKREKKKAPMHQLARHIIWHETSIYYIRDVCCNRIIGHSKIPLFKLNETRSVRINDLRYVHVTLFFQQDWDNVTPIYSRW